MRWPVSCTGNGRTLICRCRTLSTRLYQLPDSAAGDGHVARQRGPAVSAINYEIVAFRLSRDRLLNRRVEQVIGFRCPQRLSKIGCILLAKAHVKRAGASDAHTVAGLAKIVSERRDESEATAGIRYCDVTCRPSGSVFDIG